MTLLEKRDLERLKKLSKYYKTAYCKNGSEGGYFIDYTKYKIPKEGMD